MTVISKYRNFVVSRTELGAVLFFFAGFFHFWCAHQAVEGPIMPSYKQCCVPGCKKAEDVHQVLHVFPNPEKDIQRFNMWLNAIGGDLVGMDNEHIYKNRRVCNTHFELKYLCRNDRISKNAIPTLNMPGDMSIPLY